MLLQRFVIEVRYLLDISVITTTVLALQNNCTLLLSMSTSFARSNLIVVSSAVCFVFVLLSARVDS